MKCKAALSIQRCDALVPEKLTRHDGNTEPRRCECYSPKANNHIKATPVLLKVKYAWQEKV